MKAGRIATLFAIPLLLTPATVTAQQQDTQLRTVTVSAQGIVEKEPEQGLILLAVESTGRTARIAADSNTARMTQINAAIRRTGIPARNIRTVSYQITPEYAPTDRNQPRITGYRAVNMVQVTVDTVSRMGALIDAAIEAGANRVTNISFRLRDPQAAHREAVAEAIRNARREAEAVAAAAGETLGPVQSITTGGYFPPPMPAAAYARMEAMVMDAAPPIEGGTLTVTATVNVVYRLAGPQ